MWWPKNASQAISNKYLPGVERWTDKDEAKEGNHCSSLHIQFLRLVDNYLPRDTGQLQLTHLHQCNDLIYTNRN